MLAARTACRPLMYSLVARQQKAPAAGGAGSSGQAAAGCVQERTGAAASLGS
jgi:hypothetical protein